MTYRILTIAMVLAVGMVTFVSGQNTGLTRMFNDGSNITWTVIAPNAGGTLTVSTPSGEVLRREFKAGGSPIFSTDDRLAGGEGQYTFELVLAPIIPDNVRGALLAAREQGRADEVYDDFVRSGVIPPKMMETGSFRVVSGLIYTADSGAEPGEPKQAAPTTGQPIDTDQKNPSGNVNRGDVPPEDVQVINDDLVVLGSECIGLDCTTSPSFGFDTLRLSENNLRIHFQDTSSTASFPTSDWRIVANDTSNGGASYLAFEDTDAGTQPFRVEAGAGSAALWVTDSGGNVGMGTTTPVVELHIADGDTPTVRLDQTGASGFTPQVWDVAGNEANFFVRDVTNGSQLPFQIKPGADTASLFIAANNNVGVGTGTPSQRLEVRGSVLAGNNGSFIVESGSTGGITFADGTVQTTAGGGGGGGEVNTGVNVGAGQGVFKQKVGANLQFKTLTAGANVTVTPSGADEILISAASPSPLGVSYATTIFGGSGTVVPGFTVAPVVDGNSFGTGTTGGFAVLNYNIPTTSNLSDPGGANVVFNIRYRDSDGVGAGTSVTINQVTLNIASGLRTANLIFSSNSDAGTGFHTVTVCKPATFFNFNTLGNHLSVVLFSAAAANADFTFIQMYKSNTCP